jgi:hypothetical protein
MDHSNGNNIVFTAFRLALGDSNLHKQLMNGTEKNTCNRKA